MRSRLAVAAACSAVLLSGVLAGCGGSPAADEPSPPTSTELSTTSTPATTDGPESDGSGDDHGHGTETAAGPAARTPLRDGERFVRLSMPEPYTPSAPNGVGTDDYRCFLLDPHLDEKAFLTGLDVLPGTDEVVHHVILFQVPPDAVPLAERQDAAEPGEGWTCFGGTGIGDGFVGGNPLDDAPWLGAWSPGGCVTVHADDVGVPLRPGARVVMQVHYNLLAGPRPDVTSARLRIAPGAADLKPLRTVLLPAPVELPCRPGRTGELCQREAAMEDVIERFGPAGNTGNMLHLLCGTGPPGPVQRCDRTFDRPATIRAVAGHMHLLGRSLSVDVNPGTHRERRVLDIPVWNFDDQSAKPVDPVRVRAGDTVRVTCEHDQALRDVLPAFEGQEERYVVWGEGTTDEMCLGILLVTRS